MMAKYLPRNGPSGTYSQACRSRADQSFTRQTPNTWSVNSPSPIGRPSFEPVGAGGFEPPASCL
jgi:hypothetical protein